MYNDPREIIYLINLLNMNDKRPIMYNQEIFTKDGVLKEGGADILKERINGYVLFVRGVNPYSFPYKVFPNDTNNMKSRSSKSMVYPRFQYNQAPIDQPIQYLDLFMTQMSPFQQEAYDQIMSTIERENEDDVESVLSASNQNEDDGVENEKDSKNTTAFLIS